MKQQHRILRSQLDDAHAAQRDAENELSRQMARAAMREGELQAQVATLRSELDRLRTVVPISELPKGQPAHVLVYRRDDTGAIKWVDMGMTAVNLNPEYVYALPIPHPLRHPACPKILEYPESKSSPEPARKRRSRSST